MKIIICIASMGPGGAERQVAYLVEAFSRLSLEVYVILLSKGPNYPRLQSCGANIILLPPTKFKIGLLFRLIKTFRAINPNLVFLWQHPFDIIGGIAAKVLRLPCIHAERTNPFLLESKIYSSIRGIVVSMSSGIITNSNSGHMYWSAKCPNLAICKIRNIVPAELLDSVQPSSLSCGHLIAVSRLDSNKNIITLLKALSFLRNNQISIPLLIAGIGPERDFLMQSSNSLQLTSNVSFLGYRSDAWSLIKGALGFVSLSLIEGEPNSVLEAAALGKPLILSDIPPHLEFQYLPNVHFVNPLSIFETAKAIEKLYCINYKSRSSADLESPSSSFGFNTGLLSAQMHIQFFKQVIAN